MKTISGIKIGSAVFCLGIYLTACAPGEGESQKKMAEEMNEEMHDRKGEKVADKLVEAYCSNLFEISVSENAMKRATTSDVKKLAEMMAGSHRDMNEKVKSLAQSKNVTLPEGLTNEQQKELENLAEKQGIDYDKEYTSKMKDKHKESIRKLEDISQDSDDPELKEWATNVLPDIRTHLNMVETTSEKLKDTKKVKLN